MPSTTIKIRAENLGAVIKGTARTMPKVVQRALVTAAQRGVRHLKTVTPVDRGMAKAGWKVVNMATFNRVQIQNPAPYIGILERGARPHPVSDVGILAIEEWVKRVMGAQVASIARQRKKYSEKGSPRRKMKIRDLETQAAHEIAMGIVWRLRNRGAKGKFFVLDSMPLLRKWVAQEINVKVGQAMMKRGGGGEGSASGIK